MQHLLRNRSYVLYILHTLTFTILIAKINQRDKDRSSDLMSDVHFLTLRHYGKLLNRNS